MYNNYPQQNYYEQNPFPGNMPPEIEVFPVIYVRVYPYNPAEGYVAKTRCIGTKRGYRLDLKEGEWYEIREATLQDIAALFAEKQIVERESSKPLLQFCFSINEKLAVEDHERKVAYYKAQRQMMPQAYQPVPPAPPKLHFDPARMGPTEAPQAIQAAHIGRKAQQVSSTPAPNQAAVAQAMQQSAKTLAAPMPPRPAAPQRPAPAPMPVSPEMDWLQTLKSGDAIDAASGY